MKIKEPLKKTNERKNRTSTALEAEKPTREGAPSREVTSSRIFVFKPHRKGVTWLPLNSVCVCVCISFVCLLVCVLSFPAVIVIAFLFSHPASTGVRAGMAGSWRDAASLLLSSCAAPPPPPPVSPAYPLPLLSPAAHPRPPHHTTHSGSSAVFLSGSSLSALLLSSSTCGWRGVRIVCRVARLTVRECAASVVFCGGQAVRVRGGDVDKEGPRLVVCVCARVDSVRARG